MGNHSSSKPLSNLQEELLRLYSTGISDETLLEIKGLMAKFFSQKGIDVTKKDPDKKDSHR